MYLLTLAVALFAIAHLIPAVPAFKSGLQGRLGNAYGAVFGVASIVGLGLIVAGWRMAQFVPLYDPPSWGRYATFVLVLIAFVCLGIFIFRGNLRQRVRLPLAIGVVFWGAGHLCANGDQASLILFGGMILYGAAHFIVGLMNGYRPGPEVRGGHDILSILGGIALYGLVIQLHEFVIGAPVIQLQ